MPRFFYPLITEARIGDTLLLSGDVCAHIRVLRLKVGATIELFASPQHTFLASLVQIDKKSATAHITAPAPDRATAPPYVIEIAQCLPEGKKMDWIIEKSVELGATSIQPLSAQRCVSKLAAEREASRLRHWQAIAVAASEQCQRCDVPTVKKPQKLSQWLQEYGTQALIFDPTAQQPFNQWCRQNPPSPQATTSFFWLFGPEGGFSEAEHALLAPLARVHLGNRILRTETAALNALSQWQALSEY